jgi:molybdate transport system substrate-binding protein
MLLNFASAEELRIAVASNALPVIKELSRIFSAQTGHKISLSAASTGKLYAQIVNGAPYDILMAANEREPLRLVKAKLAFTASRSTYAIGRLVLYSTRIPLQDRSGDVVLKERKWSKLAIANPRTAPYGNAARQVLKRLKLWGAVQHQLVRGENISQAFYFTHSGNAELGFVALSQIKALGSNVSAEYWSIPSLWYHPLRQQMVILKRTKHKVAAEEFLSFMMSDDAREILTTKYGYGVTDAE